eukprot:5565341-Prymnesium_polylepis.1
MWKLCGTLCPMTGSSSSKYSMIVPSRDWRSSSSDELLVAPVFRHSHCMVWSHILDTPGRSLPKASTSLGRAPLLHSRAKPQKLHFWRTQFSSALSS